MEAGNSLSSVSRLLRRQGHQTQDITKGGLVDYWGYAVRVLPCANDEGTCEYFEAIYTGHETGILYSGIIWATIGGILLFWAIGRHFWAPPRASEVPASLSDIKDSATRTAGGLRKLRSVLAVLTRSYTLPESMRLIFGRTTRLQILILGLLTS
jgi:hypothetical protein